MGGMMLRDTSEHDWLEGRGTTIKLIGSINES